MEDTRRVLVSPERVRVYLDGVLQSHVTSFNTRGGRLSRYVKDFRGDWVLKELVGVVHADCDFSGSE